MGDRSVFCKKCFTKHKCRQEEENYKKGKREKEQGRQERRTDIAQAQLKIGKNNDRLALFPNGRIEGTRMRSRGEEKKGALKEATKEMNR